MAPEKVWKLPETVAAGAVVGVAALLDELEGALKLEAELLAVDETEVARAAAALDEAE